MKELMNKKYIEWTFKDALKISGVILAIYAGILGIGTGIVYLVSNTSREERRRKRSWNRGPY